jgi:hypothetical protein
VDTLPSKPGFRTWRRFPAKKRAARVPQTRLGDDGVLDISQGSGWPARTVRVLSKTGMANGGPAANESERQIEGVGTWECVEASTATNQASSFFLRLEAADCEVNK